MGEPTQPIQIDQGQETESRDFLDDMTDSFSDRIKAFKNSVFEEARGKQYNFDDYGFHTYEQENLIFQTDPKKIRPKLEKMLDGLSSEMGKLIKDERDYRIKQYQLISQFRLLREIQTFVEKMQAKYPDEKIAKDRTPLLEVAQELEKELLEKNTGFTDMEKFLNLKEVGEPITRDDAPITEKQLALVRSMEGHTLDYKDGQLVAITPFLAGTEGRNSLHLTLNHMVEPHGAGSWETAEAVFISPMQNMDLEGKKPSAFNEIDVFYYNTELPLSDDTLIIINEGNEEWEKFLKENPEIEEKYTVLRKKRADMRMATTLAIEKLGFTNIQGGEYGSDDKLVSEKVSGFVEDSGICKDMKPHFFTAANEIDDIFQIDAFLKRIRKKGEGDYMDNLDWDNYNAFPDFINYGGKKMHLLLGGEFQDSTIEDYNVSEKERSDLIKAILSVLDDVDIKDIKMPKEEYEERASELSDGDNLKKLAFARRHSFCRDVCDFVWQIKADIKTLSESDEDPKKLQKLKKQLDFLDQNISPQVKKKLDAWSESNHISKLLGH